MNELEQARINLDAAKRALDESRSAVKRDLKLYRAAKISANAAYLKNVSNNVINAFRNLNTAIAKSKVGVFASTKLDDYRLWKEKREVERAARQRIAEENRIKAEAEREERQRIAENNRRIAETEREQRRLRLKEQRIQKVNSLKSKFGRVKNSLLRSLSPSIIGAKIENAFEKAEIWGLGVLNTGAQALNTAKSKASDFTSEQIAKYHLWRMEREEQREKAQKEAEAMQAEREKERARETENMRRRQEIKEVFREEKKREKEERKLRLREQRVQKVNSLKSKFGRVKNSLLRTLSPSVVGAKIENAFDKAEIWGLGALNTGAQALNTAKSKVSDFTSEQIAKYHLWRMAREEKREEREREAAALRAERAEEMNRATANEERRQEIREVFREEKKREKEERIKEVLEKYDLEHKSNLQRKQELIEELKKQKAMLLNSREEQKQEPELTFEEGKGFAR